MDSSKLSLLTLALPPSPRAIPTFQVLLCFGKWTPAQARLSRNSAQHNTKVVRICLRQWLCVLVVPHKAQPISDLSAGGVPGQWVSHTMAADTHRVSVQWRSQASPTGLLQASRVPAPADMPRTATSQPEWAATSSRAASYTIISCGFAFLSHLVQTNFQLDKMQQGPVHLVFLDSALGLSKLESLTLELPWYVLSQHKGNRNHSQDFEQKGTNSLGRMHDWHDFKKLLLPINLRQVCCRLNNSSLKDALT